MSAKSPWRARLGFVARLAIAIAVVGWVVHQAGLHALAETFRGASIPLLFCAFAALMLETVSKGWNWGRILDSLGYGIRGRQQLRLLRLYFVAGFMGSILPSTASTDALRTVMAQRTFGGRLSAYAASIVTQNGLAWIASCMVGLISVAVLLATNRAPTYVWLAAVLFAGVVGGGIGFYLVLKYYRGLLLWILKRVLRRRGWGLRRAIRRFADALLVFERAHVRFAPLAGMAMLAAVFSSLVFAFVAAALGIKLPVIVWGMILPLVSLLGLLPISIFGFGGAQVAHVFLLQPFGVPVPQAFALSALYSVLNLLFNITGGSLALIAGPLPSLKGESLTAAAARTPH